MCRPLTPPALPAATVVTERLVLRVLTSDESRAIVDGRREGRAWADDYPTEEDVVVAALAMESGEEPQPPWCTYQVVERATEVVVGGAGFKGPPRAGVIEVGYGLAASARGRGYATEAVRALVGLAHDHANKLSVEAETDPGNTASQRVLLRAGFTHMGMREGMRWFRLEARHDGRTSAHEQAS